MITLRVIIGGRGALPDDCETVSRMAADLCRIGLPRTERDAVRALMAMPYRWQQVARLAGRALAEARQQAVANVMAEAQR